MKETLLKTRYGVPAALLALLALSGVATACVVLTYTFTTTTSEPLWFSVTDDLNIVQQGDSDDIIVHVSNASTQTAYGIFVDASVADGQVDSIAYSDANLVNSEPKLNEDLNGDSDKLDAEYNIDTHASYNIVVTVDSADDADSGSLEVKLGFLRVAEYQ